MFGIKTVTSLVAVGVALAAVPSQAAITTFASFSPIGTSTNVRWVNSSGASAGTGGTIYSTATAGGTVPAPRNVSFSFLLPQLAPFVTGVTAQFSLNGTVPNGNPALLVAGFLVQDNVAGGFSFTSTSAITVNNTTYAAGSNLLTATYGGAAIAGQRNGTSGSFSGSTSAGDTVSYTSDFLSFSNVQDSDFSISLTSVASPLQAVPTNGVPTRALRSFRSVASGTFSSDPAPVVLAVPEPESWALMVVGFGLVGLQVRRRAKSASIAA